MGWFNYEVQYEAELTRVLAYVRGNTRQASLQVRFYEWPHVND